MSFRCRVLLDDAKLIHNSVLTKIGACENMSFEAEVRDMFLKHLFVFQRT